MRSGRDGTKDERVSGAVVWQSGTTACHDSESLFSA